MIAWILAYYRKNDYICTTGLEMMENIIGLELNILKACKTEGKRITCAKICDLLLENMNMVTVPNDRGDYADSPRPLGTLTTMSFYIPLLFDISNKPLIFVNNIKHYETGKIYFTSSSDKNSGRFG